MVVQTRSGQPSSPTGDDSGGDAPIDPISGQPETPRSFSFLNLESFTGDDTPSPETEYTEETVKEQDQFGIKQKDKGTKPDRWDFSDPYESFFELLDIMDIDKQDQLLHAMKVSTIHTLMYAKFQ